MKRQTATLDDLLRRLQRDPEWVARQEKRRREFVARRDEFVKDEERLVASLRSLGFAVNSVWDLVNSTEPYPRAIPVLLDHLSQPLHLRNREGIVRALTVEDAREAAWAPLLKEFQLLSADEPAPDTAGLKDALANALSVLADEGRLKDLAQLVRDRRHGASRVFLVATLGRLGNEETLSLLKELEKDPQLRGEAQRAWRKLLRRLRRCARVPRRTVTRRARSRG